MPLLNGLVVAVLAVVLVVVRVLWPKDTLRRRREKKLFQQSVQEMLEGLDKLEDERYDEALALFKLAAVETPNKPAPVLLRVYVMGLQGQQREARIELRQSLQRWPINTLPKRLLALAYLGAGQYDRAYAAAAAAASEDPPSSAAMRTLGDICRLVERYPEAERAYLNAVKLGAPRPYAGLTWVLAAQGRVEDAEFELARAPDRVLALFEGQLALAQIHLQARRLQDAIDIYRALLQRYRNVPRIMVPYGVTLLEAHQIGKAHDVLASAANASEEDPFAHCALATVLVEQNDLAAAVAHVREALRLWPGYGSARGVYGDVLKRAGRYDAAEEQYREALRLNPFLPDVHLRLAALLRSKGEEDA
ncbi:MAG TPA: tetratricopeptide repeat protein, partial [Ktedonobacterales bacterium]|nr:tetratricopeptide repeat protein [Ktedonobacterales bacterium]